MLNILIADDHAIVRKGIKDLLGDMHLPCVIAEAADGTQALARGREHAWDLVILDVSMPGLNGIHVLTQLRQTNPRVRVLMLSMHANWRYARYCLDAGAAGYLTKDDAPTELTVAVRMVLAGKTYISRQLRDDYLVDRDWLSGAS